MRDAGGGALAEDAPSSAGAQPVCKPARGSSAGDADVGGQLENQLGDGEVERETDERVTGAHLPRFPVEQRQGGNRRDGIEPATTQRRVAEELNAQGIGEREDD